MKFDPAVVCGAVSAEKMLAHLQEFAKRVKLSGTSEELESFRYLEATLRSYGLQTNLIVHPAYISLPVSSKVSFGDATPRSITHSFSQPSAASGLTAGLVLAGSGSEADFQRADARGKIAVIDGIASPGSSARASAAGAVGQIHVSPHEHIHDMCVSSVWGSPDTETLGRLPKTVIVSIAREDGERLKQELRSNAALQATLHAEVDTGWRQTPLLVAEMDPPQASQDGPFVMFSGHHDTWYFGVMDNGAANATMLETARLLVEHRSQWKRGLRLCFWSGHSHGRYSSSAWYADNYFSELERRCVVHVNVDSTGGEGATVLADAPASAELLDLARDAVRSQAGQEIDGVRVARAGDQSFWGIGIPSLFMGMSEQPASATGNVAGSIIAQGSHRKGGGFGWWWHTPQDTLDKINPDFLVRDTRVYVQAVGRLLCDDKLPHNYALHADALARIVEGLERDLRGAFDLSALAQAVKRLKSTSHALSAASVGNTAYDAAVVAAGRILVPLDYTHGDRFVHDPALPSAPYSSLDAVRALAKLDRDSDAFRFAEVAAQRAANRVTFAVEAAIDALGRPLTITEGLR